MKSDSNVADAEQGLTRAYFNARAVAIRDYMEREGALIELRMTCACRYESMVAYMPDQGAVPQGNCRYYRAVNSPVDMIVRYSQRLQEANLDTAVARL
jgi:hypothetical protein